ncbi:helix-turn-helix domain-containing protein [Bartonella choladocola]|uniref:helix-turn-helix domain-containing protein n=1 Tax=Bartonella choladocola TaxID=2750995 RepID=UPI003B527315
MSFQAMAWAIKQKAGNATGKAVLLMLANYADEDGICFPSQSTLATECECSTRAISNWLKRFEDAGLIARETRYGQLGYRTSDVIRLSMKSLPERRSHENYSPENRSEPTGTTFQAYRNDVQSNNLSLNQSLNLSDDRRAKEKLLEAEFHETFWPAFPNKVGKPKALISFLKARKKDSLETIMTGLQRYVTGKPPDRAWLNPTTFLNQERWNDQPAPVQERKNANSNSDNRSTARKVADKMREYAPVFDAQQTYSTDKRGVSSDVQAWDGTYQSRKNDDWWNG